MNEEVKLEDMSRVLPSEVVAAISGADARSTVNIEIMQMDDQVIKADLIVFAPKSVLMIPVMNWPFVVLFTEEILFANRVMTPRIIRSPEWNGIDGKDGDPGIDQPVAGRQSGHRRGNRGLDGGDGGRGMDGLSPKIPDVYIIANRVAFEDGASYPAEDNIILIELNGVEGGNGGPGGRGGNGGQGGKGRNAKLKDNLQCRTRGPGGLGGNAGRGGRGGNGADGGEPGDVYLCGTRQMVDRLRFATVRNKSGAPGLGGPPGPSGAVGRAGNRGSADRYCNNVVPNSFPGKIPEPPHLGSGGDGSDGSPGVVEYTIVADVKDLIP